MIDLSLVSSSSGSPLTFWVSILVALFLHVFSPYLLFCFALVVQVARGQECLLLCYSIQVCQCRFLLIGSDEDEMAGLDL